MPEGWDFTETAPTDLAITPPSEMYGGEWIGVYALAVDSEDRVYVSNHGDHPMIIFDREGNFQTSWAEGLFRIPPHAFRIGADDLVYCVNMELNTLQKFTSDGKLLFTRGDKHQPSDTRTEGWDYRTIKRSGPPFFCPTDVAVTPTGEMYVTDGLSSPKKSVKS